MQIFKKSGVLIGMFLFVGAGGYLLGQRQSSNPLKPSLQTSVVPVLDSPKTYIDSLACPIDMSVGEFAEYFRLGNGTPISGKPILVSNPKVIKQSYPFIDRKKEIMAMLAGEDGEIEDGSLGVYESGKFDVDGDGKDETFMTADIYMNHRPHIVMIVKNGNIIFEAEGGGIWIEEVYEKKGFLLSEEIERFTGEYKNTRYISKDGGFLPVWTQKICYVQFKK